MSNATVARLTFENEALCSQIGVYRPRGSGPHDGPTGQAFPVLKDNEDLLVHMQAMMESYHKTMEDRLSRLRGVGKPMATEADI